MATPWAPAVTMMSVAVLGAFVCAFVAPLVYRLAGARTGWIVALFPASLAVYFATLAGSIADGGAIRGSYTWVPSLGVTFSVLLDGLSLLMVLLITGIGALVLIYAASYLAGNPQLGRFYALLLAFMGSMLGLVLADNVITLFIFWELTSISSYLLIGFDHEDAEARAAALKALLVTNAGGLAMLSGLLLLGQVGGTFEISALRSQGDVVRGHTLYAPILLLILAGAFTKSAQVPFHFWLPGAMAAPTPVSAYLHSATMVKAGIYLLARLSPTLGGTDLWTVLLTAIGALTMLVGGIVALYHTDLKRILAYATVSALGMLVLLLGLGNSTAVTGAMVFLLAHALYKGSLFLIAGIVDHGSGTRDITQLSGLRRVMPITAALGALAAISLVSFGPVLSFVGKELALEAALGAGELRVIFVPAVVLTGALYTIVAGLVGLKPFVGELPRTPRSAHEAPASMLLGPAVLGALGVALGVAPGLADHAIVAPAAAAILGRPSTVELGLWHGLNPALGLSALSVAVGVGGYLGWPSLIRSTLWMPVVISWGPGRWYDLTLAGLRRAAAAHTALVQNGYLRRYLLVVIGSAGGLGWFTLVTKVHLPRPAIPVDVTLFQLGLAALILIAAFVAASAGSRLAAVAALGVVGYGVALLFIFFGAPDLAMTQFMVETLTVILFVLAFYHLPRLRGMSTMPARVRDAAVALVAGGFVTALVLAANGARADSRVAAAYADQSYVLGHGRNIVNVILVDFRALDTMGEITVLGVAAIGVFMLLRSRPPDEESSSPSGNQQRPRSAQQTSERTTEAGQGVLVSSLILRTSTRFLVTLLLLFAVFLLLRGHNDPGGGFVGGLVCSAAFALHGIAEGAASARRALRIRPATLIGIGLLVAVGTGLAPWLRGEPFLTWLWGSIGLLGVPPVEVGSPLIFDIGVFLVVVGVTQTIFLSLAEA